MIEEIDILEIFISPIARLFLLFMLEYEMRYMRWPNLIFHMKRGSNCEINGTYQEQIFTKLKT